MSHQKTRMHKRSLADEGPSGNEDYTGSCHSIGGQGDNAFAYSLVL